jgi:hypothetical protein
MLKVIKNITEDNKSSKIISQQYQSFELRIAGRKIVNTHKKKGFTIKGIPEKRKGSAKKGNRL